MSVTFKIKHTDIAGTCFICGTDLEHVGEDHEDGKHNDTWACDACGILITFITPSAIHAYHEVEKCWIEVEPSMVRRIRNRNE